MSATEPCDLSARDARRLIGTKKLSPVELMESCLARIDAVNPALNAVVACDREAALSAARAAETAVTAGARLGALHGLPIAIKDNRAVRGMTTTNGSLLHKDEVAEADEPGVARLRAAGGIPFAKTNLPEFGAGANTTNRVFGPTGNPFDPSRTCGGSSGGSAVALATGMAPLATGSDYGGSLRTPAVFCGVSGFRPSLGVAPAVASTAILSPWGVNGPMGRSIEDAALLLSEQAYHDARDPFSTPLASGLGRKIRPADLATLRIAHSEDLGAVPVSKAVRAVFAERISRLAPLFGRLAPAHPDMGDVHDVFEVTRGLSFVAAFKDLVETRRDELDRNVVDNTERGLAYSLADVARAQVGQTGIYRRWGAFFDDWDAILLPGSSVAPFPHSQLFVEEIDGEAMPTYMRWLALTYAPTMAFACVAAVPCGVDADGLPFGLQIAGPPGADARILAIAHALEAAMADDPVTARPRPDLAALAGSGR
ncbi:MAG: amidase [Paracoccaceae bacterium]